MTYSAIVLAAGMGTRMQSAVAKQYLPLADRPVVYYSLAVFEQSEVDEIVLVVGEEEKAFVQKEIVEKYHFTKIKHIVFGGKERYDSVYAGLMAATGDKVLIHDGARPLLTKEIVADCIKELQFHAACVVGMPVKDTIKEVKCEYVEKTPDRSCLWLIQTPQCFDKKIIVSSYNIMFSQKDTDKITDDAMVVERFFDVKIKMIKGSYENIKITTAEDMIYAEAVLKNRSKRAEEKP